MVSQMRREMSELREQLARERQRNEALQRALRGGRPGDTLDDPFGRPDRDPPRKRDVDREERDVNRSRPERERSPIDLPGPPRLRDGDIRPPAVPHLKEFQALHERQLRDIQRQMEEMHRFREEHERRVRELHEQLERMMRDAPGRRQWDRGPGDRERGDRERDIEEREERRDVERDGDRRDRDRPRDVIREREERNVRERRERDQDDARDETETEDIDVEVEISDPFGETRDVSDPAEEPAQDLDGAVDVLDDDPS